MDDAFDATIKWLTKPEAKPVQMSDSPGGKIYLVPSDIYIDKGPRFVDEPEALQNHWFAVGEDGMPRAIAEDEAAVTTEIVHHWETKYVLPELKLDLVTEDRLRAALSSVFVAPVWPPVSADQAVSRRNREQTAVTTYRVFGFAERLEQQRRTLLGPT